MSQDVWPKVGASFGLVAAVLLILTIVFGPSDPPGFDENALDVQSFVLDNHGELQAIVALQFGVIAAFTWFLGSVFYKFRVAESAARLSVVALAGGLVLLMAGLLGTCATAAAVYHADALDPGVVLALWDLSIFAYAFTGAGIAVLTGAAGVLALRAGALPSLLGAYSLLVAVYVFVVGLVSSFSETGAFSPSDGVLGFIAFLAFLVWLLATSATLVSEPRSSAPPG